MKNLKLEKKLVNTYNKKYFMYYMYSNLLETIFKPQKGVSSLKVPLGHL